MRKMTRFGKPALYALLALAASAADLAAPPDLVLWYREPASRWVEALPVGNGRLGAMVFGGVSKERIQFNEHTLWNGEPHEYQHPGAWQHLPTLRDLLFHGKQVEAQKIASAEFMSIPLTQKEYQAFGDLFIEQDGVSDDSVSRYRRELNLDSAVAVTSFESGGVVYRREVFASYPAQVVVVRLTASKPGALNFSVRLQSAHEGAVTKALPGGVLSMTGQVEKSAIRYEARLTVASARGKREEQGDRVVVSQADSATLTLAGATNFVNYRDVSGDPAQRNDRTFAGVRGRPYAALLAAHQADHRALFRRVTLNLGGASTANLPTDERIRQFATSRDPQLVALLFQYGRYLLIGSSRQGGQPANLQGVWNDSNRPPWGSKYTVNINTEMNYWPAEPSNLAECEAPLFAALKEVAESGAKTAREQYAARGWVLHHNFDLWRGTAPINGSDHGIWVTGGAWLSHQLWDHYLYSGDEKFLRETAYPLMKGSAEFFADYLVKSPSKGWLISGPSNSPEQGGLVMGPTMDHQIVRSLFGAVIAASRILNVDPAFRTVLTDLRAKIAPNQIGRLGQLQEWQEDTDDPKNQHRHVSHLWGVFPGGDITAYGSPDLFAAAQKSLEFRGDAATGWSMGWKVNLWARLLDGNHSFRILTNLIQPVGAARGQGGLYPNLFDAHPPFQIDGNFGVTSGIVEMLLQSHDAYAKPLDLTDVQAGRAALIHLLPALPDAFADGSVTGLRARGGATVDIVWKDRKLVRAVIRARLSKPMKVRYAGKEVSVRAQAGGAYVFGPDLERLAR
ncbi:MAG: glycoside hydrolase family 95 protein [Acidobacteria bacterium]|nr:glycoside hydrolase family 95 protein [Acidobacteriota bacterium]